MSVKIKCFGGRPGWEFKKRFPCFSADAYIKLNFMLRRRRSYNYIEWFFHQEKIPKPLMVNIETINRCNSTCDFCPANKHSDRRPFVRMSNEVFYKIIQDLKSWGYEGYISLYVNDEPLMDPRIIEFHKYVKEQLPGCKVKFFTNGLLLDLDKFNELIPYVDYMTINNYTDKCELHKNIKQLYRYLDRNKEIHKGKQIKISIRYIHDILTNRAGEAPNKKKTTIVYKEPCLFPYTDLTIFSDGRAGICCNDATEKTDLGNVKESFLGDIWEEKQKEHLNYCMVREKIRKGRQGLKFCCHCDTLDTGLRVKVSSARVKD